MKERNDKERMIEEGKRKKGNEIVRISGKVEIDK